MNGRFLLDTNIVIALFANESAVIDFLNGVDEVFVPSIVMVSYTTGLESQFMQRKISCDWMILRLSV